MSTPQFGTSVVLGASVHTDMLIYKVCHYEFGYNETVCEDLNNEVYEDVETEGGGDAANICNCSAASSPRTFYYYSTNCAQFSAR